MYRPSVVLTLAVWALSPIAASAQALPAGPVSAFDGRLAVGAGLVAGIALKHRLEARAGVQAPTPAGASSAAGL